MDGKSSQTSCTRAVIGLCTALGLAALAGAQPRYSLTWLGDLGGGSSFASGLNDGGQVVGSSRVPGGEEHAFLWTKEGGMQDLGQYAGHDTEANAINNIGQIVGWTIISSSPLVSRAWIWTASSGFQDLGSLGADYSWALAINNAGTVIGVSQEQFLLDDGMGHLIPVKGNGRAFRWRPADGMENLHTLIGRSPDGSSSANGINDQGTIVGTSSTLNAGHNHGFVWTDAEGMQDLGTPLGRPITAATGINNEGTITGYSIDPTGYTSLGFWYLSTGGMENVDTCATIDLTGTLLCGTSGQALGINDQGQIIGVYSSTYLGNRPFVRTDDAMIDPSAFLFPGSGWGNINRMAINGRGQICGSLRFNGGEYERAFLLTPICVGDLNFDHQVDDADFVIFAAAYDILDCADPTMPVGCPADLNGDAVVDDSDFVIFVQAYDALLCP